jgi:hypothetical protein
MPNTNGFLTGRLEGLSASVRLCRGYQEYLYRLVKRLSGQM